LPKIGRPLGKTSKSSITRSLNIPGDLYKKCIWIADRWTKEALTDASDGIATPEYWTFSRVVASVMAEYFDSLEAKDPDLTLYFENCRLRDAEAKSIYKGD
jgi:hypothetical protein